VWTKVTPAVGNTVTPTGSAANGTYGRFRYVPSKDVFILVNSVDENVFVYRLNSGATPCAKAALNILADPMKAVTITGIKKC